MITTFQNSHNMYCLERTMKVQTIYKGIILPQTKVVSGPMWGLGGVCDEKNEFVELSSYDGGWATHGGYYEWKEEQYVECDVVYFGMFFNHWGHFLVDLLGRLWYFVQNKSKVKLAYLGDEEPGGNFLEVFSLLGIEHEDMIHITKPTRFKNVIVPEFSCKSCVWYTDEYKSIFDRIILRVMQEGYEPNFLKGIKKVYFTRLSFGKAKSSEFGEENIVKWLECNGFKIISPEKLSVRDQIYIWNHAEEVVCLDGSIPISIAFSNNQKLKLTVLHKTHLEHLNLELFLLMRPCDVTLLDTWYEPFKGYPKNIGAGPFLLHLGDDAKNYSIQRNWIFPFDDKRLKKARLENTIKLFFRIINIGGKTKLLLSKIVPKSVKKIVRGIWSHES